MSRYRTLFFIASITCCLLACKKDKPAVNPFEKLAGTWNLQKQEIKTYTGSDLNVDSVFFPDLNYTIQLQFDRNSNVYSTLVTYPIGGGNKGQGLVYALYQLSGSIFSTNKGDIEGLPPGDNFFSNTVSKGGPVKEHAIEVRDLTINSLVFHTEWTYTSGGGNQIFKATQDYYFVK